MDSVCRTCLCIIKNGRPLNPIDQLKPDCEVNDRQKLETCVPELSVDIVIDPVICESCKENLALAFRFKTMCLEAERTLYGYIQQRRQNENCTNLLNPYDLLALVRNDIIQEHSYSTFKKQDNATMKQPTAQKMIVNGLSESYLKKNLIEEPLIPEEEKREDSKRILRPRMHKQQTKPRENVDKSKVRTRSAEKSKKSIYICNTCNANYKRKAHLAAHVRIHKTNQSRENEKWPRRLQSNARAKFHKNQRHQCGSCNHSFKNSFSYKRHFKRFLGSCASTDATPLIGIENDINEINKNVDSSLERRRSKRLQYICRVCRRRFTSSFSLNRHEQQHAIN